MPCKTQKKKEEANPLLLLMTRPKVPLGSPNKTNTLPALGSIRACKARTCSYVLFQEHSCVHLNLDSTIRF